MKKKNMTQIEIEKTILICKKIYLHIKSIDFEIGSQTKTCKEFALIHNIDEKILMRYTSLLKCHYKINKRTFGVNKVIVDIIKLIKDISFYELDELIYLIEIQDDKFDLLQYLIDNKNLKG